MDSTIDFTIKSYDSDSQGNMNLSSFFLFLQKCAWENAKINGFGYEFVESQKALWVLSKVKLQIEQFPQWKESIQIKTWPRGPKGLFAIRDYQLIINNEVKAGISSHWLILDKTSKRPRRITDFEFSKKEFPKEYALDDSMTKIMIGNELQVIDHRKVYASDIDVNGHVNNATYVKWIMDAHAISHAKPISDFEIHFLSELYLNDSFIIYHSIKEGKFQYVIKNQKNQKSICQVEMH